MSLQQLLHIACAACVAKAGSWFLAHNVPPLLLMLINALGAAAAVVVAYGYLHVFNTVCFDTSLVMSDLCLLYMPPGTVTTVCLAHDWWQLM